jgi:hypothetical protein
MPNYQRLTKRTQSLIVSPDDIAHIVITGDTLQNPAGSLYKSSIQQIVYELLLGGLLVISGQNIFSGINGELRISETNI